MPAEWHDFRDAWRARRDPPSFLFVPEPVRIESIHQPRTVPRWALIAAAVVTFLAGAFGAWALRAAWLAMRHVIH